MARRRVGDVLEGSRGASLPWWHLTTGDCLPWLAERGARSVDHVIVDPPYSSHVHAHMMSNTAAPSGYGYQDEGQQIGEALAVDMGFASLTAEGMQALAGEYARIVRRWVLVFTDVESSHRWRGALQDAGLVYYRTGAWVKVGPTPQFSGDRPGVGFEAIVIAHAPGKHRWNGGGRAGVWRCPGVKPAQSSKGELRVHPTQKPIQLMRALVEDFTDPGELIVDSHVGSGTTGAAALELGRRFLGCEINEEWAQGARERLSGAAGGRTMADVATGQQGLLLEGDET